LVIGFLSNLSHHIPLVAVNSNQRGRDEFGANVRLGEGLLTHGLRFVLFNIPLTGLEVFENDPAAVDDGDNEADLFFDFIDDAIGTVDEFSDGLVVKFRNHPADQRCMLEPQGGLDNMETESLGIDS